ncbi:MAG: hypothetical protein IJI57_04450 [Flexilinea sp.]|nr:hypothetical protein [Flexilinea sp.]
MTLKDLIPIFALFGFIFSLACIICLLIFAGEAIREVIRRQRIRYKQQHRFDKPPLAKCYCVDCRKFNQASGECRVIGLCMAEDWFCWSAEPVKEGKI